MKVQYLFDRDKYLVRKTASEKEFEDIFKDFLPDFFFAYEYAFLKMCEQRSKRKKNEMTSRWPSDNMNGYIFAWLAENPKTAQFLKKKSNTFYFEMGQYKLTFKKVDSFYRPSYIPTEHSILLQQNLTSSEDDLMSIVFIGYQVDEAWLMLKGVYAISRNGDKLNWVIDLEDKAQGYTMPSISTSILTPSTGDQILLPEPEVKLKIKEQGKDRDRNVG